MFNKPLLWSLCLCAWAALTLTACPDDPSPDVYREPPPADACTRGGAVAANGASLLVTPGSFAGDQPLCLTLADVQIPNTPGIVFSAQGVVGVTPYGARLSPPVRLTLPIYGEGNLVVLRADGPQASAWEVLRDFSRNGAAVSLLTEKTGVFVVANEFGRPPCEVTNRCGGCSILEAQPGTPCGPCGLDLVACLGPDQITCTGATTNACGGCAFLPAAPETPCGSCGQDVWMCQSIDEVACSGETTNACGGCAALSGAPGDACGPCGLDRLVCDGGDALVCDGITESNACGGCAPLPGVPGEVCGACSDGAWACQGATLVCQGAALANACGGCGELEADPGDPCGPCEDGVWMCQERALTCQGAARICPDERAYVSIEPGSFTFGSSPDEPGRGEPERAATPLTIERRFLLQATEVTQAQWEEVMEDNPSTRSNCPGCPVENLSFFAALEYLNRLSRAEQRAPCYVCGQISDGAELPCADLDGIEGRYVRFAGLDCEGYRLPTEAEWEYAARAGTTTPWPCGDDAACLPATAWFGESSRNRAQPVAQLEPNAWGLYDMQGNVAERVWGALEHDPASATYVWQEAHRGILRGGDFYGDANACRSAALTLLNPNGWSARWQSWGLRAARTLPAE